MALPAPGSERRQPLSPRMCAHLAGAASGAGGLLCSPGSRGGGPGEARKIREELERASPGRTLGLRVQEALLLRTPDLPRLLPLKPTSAPKPMQKQDHGICDGVLSDQAELQAVPRTERRHTRASSQPC